MALTGVVWMALATLGAPLAPGNDLELVLTRLYATSMESYANDTKRTCEEATKFAAVC